jgi:hypothetical protein
VKFWARQVLVALDQLINAILGGWADESISARAWRCRERWPYRAYRFGIDLLFFWDRDHCETAYHSEIERAQFPPEYRDHFMPEARE